MTIQNRALWDQRTNLKECADTAPAGAYEDVKRANQAVEDAIEAVMASIKYEGFEAAGDDRAANLEAAIYGYLKDSNPESNTFILGEAFGIGVTGPAAERILKQAKRNVEFFASR